MTKIKFGTDGWRAIIAKEYTVDNVARVSIAVAGWVKKNYTNPSIVIGHDCRFAGDLFAETAIKVFVSQGVKVVTTTKGFVSTPMISLATVELKASLGVVITASHNPPSYNGYKLKGDFGGPLLPNDVTLNAYNGGTDWSCTDAMVGGQIEVGCSFNGELAISSSSFVTIDVTATSDINVTSITNQMDVTAFNLTGPQSDQALVNLVNYSAQIGASHTPNPVDPGAQFDYEITVTNDGTEDLNNINTL